MPVLNTVGPREIEGAGGCELGSIQENIPAWGKFRNNEEAEKHAGGVQTQSPILTTVW
jgi:hypothetical protein